MMNGYTPNDFNNENETNVREFTTDSNTNNKKSKKRIAALMAANLMAMALVSAGTVCIYHNVEKKDSDTKVVTEYVDKTSSTLSASPMGLIDQAAEAEGGYTTEAVVQKLLPSVVGIKSGYEVTSRQQSYEDFFGFGYGGQQNSTPSTQKSYALGTGVIISEDGYIVTNAHVIYDSENGLGLSKDITVSVNDDQTYEAKVIGYDTSSDLAVLKIEAEDLTAAEFGDSDALQLGESVIAIGNPLGFDLKNTVTTGVVSGKDRNISVNDESLSLLQTDAAINSGNSGGPLINKYGKVIGINSSKMSSSYSEASIDNIGFAIPSNDVARIVKDLIDNGHITSKCKLGISCRDVDESMASAYGLPVGVYVIKVADGSAAEEAGLCYGDIITAVDGVQVKSVAQLNNQKNKHEPGDTIELTISRSGKEETVKLVLDEADEEEASTEEAETTEAETETETSEKHGKNFGGFPFN
jgi:serine protease Do